MILRVIRQLERLGGDPRPAGCKKLRGDEGLWRVRVGEYRIVYHIDDAKSCVDIRIIRHRKDIYR